MDSEIFWACYTIHWKDSGGSNINFSIWILVFYGILMYLSGLEWIRAYIYNSHDFNIYTISTFAYMYIYIYTTYISTFNHKMLSRFFIQQPSGSTWLFCDTKDIATTGLPSRPFRWFIMHVRTCQYVMKRSYSKVHRRWLLSTINHEAISMLKSSISLITNWVTLWP